VWENTTTVGEQVENTEDRQTYKAHRKGTCSVCGQTVEEDSTNASFIYTIQRNETGANIGMTSTNVDPIWPTTPHICTADFKCGHNEGDQVRTVTLPDGQTPTLAADENIISVN
jgi:hypothetical protein